MKRNTPMHPKTGMLAAMLNVKRYQAVGILEMLWHFTAQYCPAGDVGKRTNAQIAAFVDWPVDDADRLIEALLDTGWLDRDPEHRLLIHDWHEHSDGTCDKYLSDHGLKYATSHDPRRKNGVSGGRSRDKSRQVVTSRDSRAGARVPESESESESSPLPLTGSGGDVTAGGESLGVVYGRIVATGNFPQLTPEMLARAFAAWPDLSLDDEEVVDGLVLEAQGLSGRCGTVMPWLSKVLGRIELDRKKKMAGAVLDGKGDLMNPRNRAASASPAWED